MNVMPNYQKKFMKCNLHIITLATLFCLILGVSIEAKGNPKQSSVTIKGLVLDELNIPIIGANITEKGTLNGTISDVDGNFVLQVNNENAVLSGIFQIESNLRYSVIGTFSPGHVPSSNHQEIFRYDGCNDFTVSDGGLIQETSLNTPPSKNNETEYYIARVKVNGVSVLIEDKRTEIYQSSAEYKFSNVNKSLNPYVGVEAVKWDHPKSPRHKNEIVFGWGLRSSNWTLSSSNREIIISDGKGGRFKESAIANNFINGSFNGWRLYANNGSYQKIIGSVVDGSSIKVTLDNLNPSDYISEQQICIVPDVDEISIKAISHNQESPILDTEEFYPIQGGWGSFFVTLPVQTGLYSYNLQYRYKKNGEFTQWNVFPNDNNPSDTYAGFYTEASFTEEGQLKDPGDRIRKKYTSHPTQGFIECVPASNNYLSTIQSFISGDLFGVEVRNLPSGNLCELQVGIDKQVQIFTGIVGDSLTSNYVIHLKKTGAINGNKFHLIFDGKIVPDLFFMSINQNYVSAASSGTKLKLFSDTEHDYMLWPGKQVVIECQFDGTDWKVITLETDKWRLGDIKMAMHVELNGTNFTSQGYGKSNEYLGWALCYGETYASALFGSWIGTNLKNKFVRGTDGTNYATSGGQNTVTQVINHSHPFSGTTPSGGSHSHRIRLHGGSGGSAADRGGNVNQNYVNSDAAIRTDLSAHTHTFSGTTSNPTGGVSSIDNRPEFYTVAYLQRVPYVETSGIPKIVNEITPTNTI